MKSNILCLAFILIIFVVGIFIKANDKDDINDNISIIKVDIKGQVQFPGTYYVRYGISLAEMLDECGGITSMGSLPYGFDYNSPIHNNITIVIPRKHILRKNLYEEQLHSE